MEEWNLLSYRARDGIEDANLLRLKKMISMTKI
jgi:hypothetical protein